VPGVQINRFCASGLDAVNFAAAQVMSGQQDLAIGGGVESMSRVGIGAAGNAWAMDPQVALPGYFMPGEKKLQIAFAPGKRFIEAQFLKGYFQAKAPEFAHVPWIPLIEMSRQDCAGIMGQSAVFATLPLLESLGLTALEAMAADCHVVGYTGHGGAEYATPQNGDWIAEGDHDGFVAKLRQACALFGSDNPKLAAGRATAAQFSRAGFERELAGAWNAILGESAPRYRN